MDNAKQHWKILQELGNDLAIIVRSFLVVGKGGEGVIVVTENGDGFWLGKMWFGWGKTKTLNEPTLLDVSDLVHMAQGENYILLLNSRGEIYSMGRNNHGQLGLGTVDKKTYFSPQLISIQQKFISVRCGVCHSLALTEDGKVWAWGTCGWGNVYGPDSAQPIPVPRRIFEHVLRRIIAVECGGNHSLALTDQGEVYAWGGNEEGQLGNGSKVSMTTSTRIPTHSPVQSMAAGCFHTLLLTPAGEVYACGNNENGQLGFSTSTISSPHLSKVAGLPPISQIASHPLANLSIAMSSDQRCFVWGELNNKTFIFTPWELTSVYNNVVSPLSFFSLHRNTPHSVSFPANECSHGTDVSPDRTLPANNHLLDCIGKMFDNPDSSPDVRFQVGDQSIMAHRSVLQISSGHFNRLFSSHSANLNPTSSISSTPQSGPSRFWPTTNPLKLEKNCTPTTLQVTISIPDHSYPAFHAYLRFLYQGILELEPEHLTDLFSLSVDYLESNLQQLCLSRMRTTLSSATCCLYYQFIVRHPMLELDDFQQELLQFISNNFFEVIDSAAYLSMDAELCKKLTLSVVKHSS